MSRKQSRIYGYLCFFFVCIMIISAFLCGCSHIDGEFPAGSTFKEADDFFSQGFYTASLSKYEQIIDKYPNAGDRALFEMGMIYVHPGNKLKNYQKALECFEKLIKNYPESEYRQDSEVMISLVNDAATKDKSIISQKTRIESLEREVKNKRDEIVELQQKTEPLEQEVKCKANEIIVLQEKIKALKQYIFAVENGPADKILIEKKDRRLTLISKNKVLKTYKIALGGNPNGPKEKQGDYKTPEGNYFIDSKNNSKRYHLCLHISYPNEKDKKRANELGVSPGSDIVIHGIKNGFSWVGGYHTNFNWTKGCIAVTDEEIEELDKLVPNGTAVEIRP